jgi:predicted phage terminase large subunit-like protein
LFEVDAIHIVEPHLAPPMRRRLRYWDKAGTKGAGKRTAGVMIGDAGPGVTPRYYFTDIVKFQEEMLTREATIRKTALKDGYEVDIVVEQEPGSGGKDSAKYSIRGLAGFRITADKVTGEKMLRAGPLADQVAIGNVAVIRAPWTKEFLEEMRTYGPTAKYKDQVDAACGGFARIVRRPIVFSAF